MTSRRRVTLVANELRGFHPAGGMGTATTFLALALARMGHAVEMLNGVGHDPSAVDPEWGQLYADAGVMLRSARESDEPVSPWHFEVPHRTELALRAEPPDVVVVHDFSGPASSALRLREAGLAFEDTLFVIFCHGPRRYILEQSRTLGVSDLRELLSVSIHEQESVELADVVVSPSAYLLDWMRRDGWQLPDRTFVIPYFTRSSATAAAVRKAARGSDDRVRRLAFFGRLDERKGIQEFAAGLNALEPRLLEGLEVAFVGKTTGTWPRGRIESLLSESTKRALRTVSFETELDQQEALAELSHPGTLVVMPSLQDNSPNTVYECLEYEIPFVASNVGGVPELIAADEHARVLFEPTASGTEAALRRVLAGNRVLRPVRPSFTSAGTYERWAEVIEMRPRRRTYTVEAEVDVVVRRRSPETPSRCLSALDRQTYRNFRVITADEPYSAPWVVFLEEGDLVDDTFLETLVRGQAASDADVVSCGLRLENELGEHTLHFFSGEPHGLGALSNAYGTVALVRRSLLPGVAGPWAAEADADWPLLARVAASGARIVSVPLPLVTRRGRPGSVEDNPSDALLAVQELEHALPREARSLARLAAGLAADTPPPAADRRGSVLYRALRRVI